MKRDRASDIDAFLKKPDPAIRLVLLHGGDKGLARERADRLHRTVVDDLHHPFRVVRLTGDALSEDSARLNDEAAAIAMGGGRKVIRVTDTPQGQGGQKQTAVLAEFAEAPAGDALVIVEADALPASHALRKAVEAADAAMAIACYPDEDEALDDVVRETLARFGLAATEEATAFLVDHLGGDRLVSRRELEKLALYAGSEGRTRAQPITLEEAAASVGDTSELTFDDLCGAVAGGDRAMVDRCVTRLEAEGESAVAVLRIVGTHFRRFHTYHALSAGGRPPAYLMKSWRLFGPRAARFEAAARAWQGAVLVEAFRRINEAETRCKLGGFPDWIVTARTLLALAGMSGRTGGRR